MGKFEFHNTPIQDLIVIEPKVYEDHRGYFFESYNQNDFEKAGITTQFIQDNQSRSYKGVLRGLHFQTNPWQCKLVRVVYGEVFDVAVDIRIRSATYGQWYGIVLSASNQKQLYVPEGFAHGFYVLSDEAEFVYKCNNYYDPQNEGGIIWNDKDLSIQWRIKHDSEIILSNKDQSLMTFEKYDKKFNK